MFTTGGFPQTAMPFVFPGQQAATSIYQSQFGGFNGFNQQMVAPFQAPTPLSNVGQRGQSMPAAAGRQFQQQGAPFSPAPNAWSRRQPNDQYQVPVVAQQYEYRSHHGSKSKKHSKRRTVSPNGAAEPGLYSDKERRDVSDGQKGRVSRSPSPSIMSRSKHDEVIDHEQQKESLAVENNGKDHEQNANSVAPVGVARSEEEQAVVNGENASRRKSSSKKKRSHRREQQEPFNGQPLQSVPIDSNGNNPYPNGYQTQPYVQAPAIFNEYQNELPPQLKVHRQPLYSGYTQAYEESIRRGDIYRKQAKRSARLPPEVKQQLLPHEDDMQPQSIQPQTYTYTTPNGFPSQVSGAPQSVQPYINGRQPYNPYQPYTNQGNYFGQGVGNNYNAIQPWTAGPVTQANGSAEQEIQRLRSHIHTLEGELHKLQKKLNKTSLNAHKHEHSEQTEERQHDEHSRARRRSKREETASPRQTPVIVELNHGAGETVRESSSKKHRRRTASATSSQQGTAPAQQPAPVQQVQQQESASVQRTTETVSVQQPSNATSHVTSSTTTVTATTSETRSVPATVEQDERATAVKVAPAKSVREETAAQLAHAAAAHVQSRQAATVPVPPPNAVGPQPPTNVVRPSSNVVPQQQQQQQQFVHQQTTIRVQAPQSIRGPAPRLVGPPAGIRFTNDPFRPPMPQQYQPQLGGMPVPNPNYNQSNNNELASDNDDDSNTDNDLQEEQQSRHAEQILDAFERFYLNSGKTSSTPIKVKFIPNENNSKNRSNQGNLNNNNNHDSTSSKQTRSQSPLSTSSSSESSSIYSSSSSSRRSVYENDHRNMVYNMMGPFM